jgi:hypothetical protein
MAESVLVRVGDTEFLAQVAEGGGPQVVGLREAFSFDGVRETIEAVAEQLSRAWEKVQPSEASVEFGISLSTKTGKLSALLVEGGGEATLKITLSWKTPSNG